MKKLIEFSPLIVAVIIIAMLIAFFAMGVFDAPEDVTITSTTLTEVVETANLATAKYIQHGIVRGHVAGTENGYILYYATVRPNVKFDEIVYTVDPVAKEVTVTIPEKFEFDVELLEDSEHQFYYYPKKKDDWTAKIVAKICEKDAKQKAEANKELISTARESLINTIEALLNPMLSKSGYTFVVG